MAPVSNFGRCLFAGLLLLKPAATAPASVSLFTEQNAAGADDTVPGPEAPAVYDLDAFLTAQDVGDNVDDDFGEQNNGTASKSLRGSARSSSVDSDEDARATSTAEDVTEDPPVSNSPPVNMSFLKQLALLLHARENRAGKSRPGSRCGWFDTLPKPKDQTRKRKGLQCSFDMETTRPSPDPANSGTEAAPTEDEGTVPFTDSEASATAESQS